VFRPHFEQVRARGVRRVQGQPGFGEPLGLALVEVVEPFPRGDRRRPALPLAGPQGRLRAFALGMWVTVADEINCSLCPLDDRFACCTECNSLD
jgi:hypothetical protein